MDSPAAPARLEPLSARNETETLDYLARAPYDNVYVYWLIRSGIAARGSESLAISRDASGAVDGVCYFGRQIVPYVSSDAALEAFAERARAARAPAEIVAPRPMLERFWAKAGPHLPAPRAVRRSQPVYALDRAHLRGSRTDAAVGVALAPELEELNRNSAAMFEHEFGREAGSVVLSQHRERTRRILEAGWWWRYRAQGHIVFQCNLGSQTPFTAQIQGVWTPRSDRGKGYATRGLAAICDRLLDENPSLCLFVNDFNASAIALYERVGFFRAGEFATILF